MVKIIHIAAMELFTVYILWNVIRMWLKKPPVKSGIFKITAFALGIIGIAAGIYLFAHYYHFHSPGWLQVKFILIALSVIAGIAGSIKHSKWMLLSSFLLNVSVVIIANIKF
jgi:hypothetical protein